MECRLCLHAVLEDASPEDAALAFPCDCRGSPVHWGCLRRWQQAQVQRAAEAARSADEARARAATCEVCGARLAAAGGRKRPLAERAVCRAHGGEGKVALRRVPTLSRASRNFSEFSAADGQEVEVLEQDDTGEFFRVRARKAPRYREQGSAALAEGWIRHIYLEWPAEVRGAASSSMPAPRMPAAYGGEAGDVAGVPAGSSEEDLNSDEYELLELMGSDSDDEPMLASAGEGAASGERADGLPSTVQQAPAPARPPP